MAILPGKPPEDKDDAANVAPTTPPVASTPETQLPSEAQGEVNGGPLGCCLGVVVGLFLAALVSITVSILLANGGFLGFATVPFFILGAIAGGYIGWRIGKRLYREYDPPAVKPYPSRSRTRSRRMS